MTARGVCLVDDDRVRHAQSFSLATACSTRSFVGTNATTRSYALGKDAFCTLMLAARPVAIAAAFTTALATGIAVSPRHLGAIQCVAEPARMVSTLQSVARHEATLRCLVRDGRWLLVGCAFVAAAGRTGCDYRAGGGHSSSDHAVRSGATRVRRRWHADRG
jgi:hypothetical protein